MSTLTTQPTPELSAAEAAAGLHARMATLTAQLAQHDDVVLRRELIGISAAARILTDTVAGLLDRCTVDDVTEILTTSPVIATFRATPELLTWLAEHEEWDLQMEVGAEVLTRERWKCDEALARAAAALASFSRGDMDEAEVQFDSAVDERSAFEEASEWMALS